MVPGRKLRSTPLSIDAKRKKEKYTEWKMKTAIGFRVFVKQIEHRRFSHRRLCSGGEGGRGPPESGANCFLRRLNCALPDKIHTAESVEQRSSAVQEHTPLD